MASSSPATELGVHRVRQSPSEDLATGPVHNRQKVEEAAPHLVYCNSSPALNNSQLFRKVNCPASPARSTDQQAIASSRPKGSSRPTAARSSKPARWQRKARATRRISLPG